MRVACVLLVPVLLGGAACRRHHPPASADEVQPVAAAPAPEAPGEPAFQPPPLPPPPAPPVAAAPIALGKLTTTTGAVDGGTVNGDPKGPRAEALNAVVSSAMPRLQRCLDDAEVPAGRELIVEIKYTIEPNGRTSGVAVSGPAPPRALDCMRDAVESMRFPEFEGRAVEGAFPFAYRRDVR